MKVILLKDVDNTGNAHEVINVSEGYARNFLFPKKLAMPAEERSLKDLERIKKRHEGAVAAKKEEMKKTAADLEAKTYEIETDAGESGKLFGSVTGADIAAAVKKASGIDIDKKKIVIEEPIKTLGDFTVTAKVFQDIEAKLNIKVTAAKK